MEAYCTGVTTEAEDVERALTWQRENEMRWRLSTRFISVVPLMTVMRLYVLIRDEYVLVKKDVVMGT